MLSACGGEQIAQGGLQGRPPEAEAERLGALRHDTLPREQDVRHLAERGRSAKAGAAQHVRPPQHAASVAENSSFGTGSGAVALTGPAAPSVTSVQRTRSTQSRR